MPFHSAIHHRQSLRLPGYDYTQTGAYFVTLVTVNREELFGSIEKGIFDPTAAGTLALREWERLPTRFNMIRLDAFVVMPNHVHGLLILIDPEDVQSRQKGHSSEKNGVNVPAGSLGAVVRAYKASTAFSIHKLPGLDKSPVWQRNYYEHIVRDERDFERIRAYIEQNPQSWDKDQENITRK